MGNEGIELYASSIYTCRSEKAVERVGGYEDQSEAWILYPAHFTPRVHPRTRRTKKTFTYCELQSFIVCIAILLLRLSILL